MTFVIQNSNNEPEIGSWDIYSRVECIVVTDVLRLSCDDELSCTSVPYIYEIFRLVSTTVDIDWS